MNNTNSAIISINVSNIFDLSYPQFSNYLDNNASLIIEGVGFFNVSVQNTNGTVWLEINNTNITATNISGSMFNASYNFSLNGSYNYRWHAYGNGTSRLYNYSNTLTYFVSSCSPIYQNSSWSDWQGQTLCRVNNTFLENRSLIEYDLNSCGSNITLWEERESECDYCTPNLVNSSWSDWVNLSCNSNLINQSRQRIQYDNNYCNEIDNQTFVEYRNEIDCSINLNIITPENRTYNNKTQLINISSDGESIWYNWNGTNISYSSVGYIYFNNGTINLTVYSNDSAGNINSSSTSFFSYSDLDFDGIPDVNDSVLYDLSSVNNSGIASLNITIAGNSSWGAFLGVEEVALMDSTTKICNFSFNFSENFLDLSKITLIKGTNSIIINLSGQLQIGVKKTIYISDNNFISLCVKDEDISSINEISSSCTGSNETDFSSCLGASAIINGISCSDEGSIIKIENLQHSAVKGNSVASETNSGSISSNYGGGCITNWSCSSWSDCINGSQVRTCYKSNNFCYAGVKPEEVQTCIGLQDKLNESNIPSNKGDIEIIGKTKSFTLPWILMFIITLIIIVISYFSGKIYGLVQRHRKRRYYYKVFQC